MNYRYTFHVPLTGIQTNVTCYTSKESHSYQNAIVRVGNIFSTDNRRNHSRMHPVMNTRNRSVVNESWFQGNQVSLKHFEWERVKCSHAISQSLRFGIHVGKIDFSSSTVTANHIPACRVILLFALYFRKKHCIYGIHTTCPRTKRFTPHLFEFHLKTIRSSMSNKLSQESRTWNKLWETGHKIFGLWEAAWWIVSPSISWKWYCYYYYYHHHHDTQNDKPTDPLGIRCWLRQSNPSMEKRFR